jgi:hypothetical protein
MTVLASLWRCKRRSQGLKRLETGSAGVIAGSAGGLVERVTFHNEENGFCVLRTRARGHRDLVTFVGQAAVISAGEWITASGEWVNGRTHGAKFRARFLKTSAPTSIEGIEKYLGSGMIRGIGPAYAKKLVRASARRCSTRSRLSPIVCARWPASARCGPSRLSTPGPSRRSCVRS